MPVIKNPPASAGDARDAGSNPESGRSPGIGNGNPLQYSCLENPVDRGAWWATAHEVTKSQSQLSNGAHRYPETSRTAYSNNNVLLQKYHMFQVENLAK